MNGSIIHPGVVIGKNVEIEEFCIIGKPAKDAEGPTIIGDNSVIRSHTVIYAGTTIGNNFQTGHHALVRENTKIGNNVSVGSGSCVEHHVEIQDDVRIHSQAFIPEFSKLEKGAWIGPNVVLTNARYPRSRDVKNRLVGPTIGKNARIGANSTLLPGVKIGENALIGAGSVVTKDVLPGKVAYGNPAEEKSEVEKIEFYKS